MYKLVVNRQMRDVRSTSNNGKIRKRFSSFIRPAFYTIAHILPKNAWIPRERTKKNERRKKRHRFHRTSYSSRYLVSTQAVNVFQDKSVQVIDTALLLSFYYSFCVCVCVFVCVAHLKATLLSYPLQWRSPQQSDFDKGLYACSHSF